MVAAALSGKVVIRPAWYRTITKGPADSIVIMKLSVVFSGESLYDPFYRSPLIGGGPDIVRNLAAAPVVNSPLLSIYSYQFPKQLHDQ